jgi:hypothetical protein
MIAEKAADLISSAANDITEREVLDVSATNSQEWRMVNENL